MTEEKSCGAVVYSQSAEVFVYLILRHTAGHWSFPKGHMEGSETEIETALREISEETGLTVKLDPGFRQTNIYAPKPDVTKEVIYFIARSASLKVRIQLTEITAMQWCPLPEALTLLTYETDRMILRQADAYLKSVADK
ncbi:Diadenosine hexaphosphate hydrolase [bioreactor metagenome]|uniref:Bis(5'-nucleosyl)-tetraphosphatase [asymmetrical] n=1 Tax=bioreactor metagenome TaxID=1076179 RepID=A0A644ZG70_9ZZZZ